MSIFKLYFLIKFKCELNQQGDDGKESKKAEEGKERETVLCKVESLRRAARCNAPLKCSKPSLLAFLSPCFSPQSPASHALYASKVLPAAGSRWSTFPLFAELFI